MANFAGMNLSQTMLSSLKKQGYAEPSPVQANIIPRILRGESLVVQSATGTGKTHTFLIPIIDEIDFNLPRLQAIIIAPSRELARQIFEFARPFQSHFQKMKVRLISSEAEKRETASGLSEAPHIIIGTPGRLKDILINDYPLDLRNVKTVVLDEADMLMELGYFEDIDELYKKLKDGIQTLVFSATMHEDLKEELSKYIKSDFLFEGEKDKTSSSVRHHLLDIKHIGTNEALLRFLKIRNPYLCLVFSSTKEGVNNAYSFLKENNFEATYFSGDLETRERKKIIRLIKENRYQVIVCSDLLSRGIDIGDVSDVVSLDLPSDLSYYHHRAGRSGRFGKDGDSWVFYNLDNTKRALALMDEKVPFDFYVLKQNSIAPDPVGLAPKKKLSKKKEFSEEERREVKIAKANSRVKKVKPGYKKKMQRNVERVKNKYRRKAIQKAVHRSLTQKKKDSSDE